MLPYCAELSEPGGWGNLPQGVNQSVNPIQIREAEYAHHITTLLPPPGSSDFPTALLYCYYVAYTHKLPLIPKGNVSQIRKVVEVIKWKQSQIASVCGFSN